MTLIGVSNPEDNFETGSWKLEAGSWKLDTGSWKLNSEGNCRYPVSSF
jgi:hypothetical protein